MQVREEMVRISELAPSERPREKLYVQGAAALTDRELLAVLIGSGSPGKGVNLLATEVLPIIDRRSGRVKIDDLTAITGLGIAKAAVLAAAMELARRHLCPERRKIAYPADVLPMVNHFADRKQEHFLCLSLNGAHEVTALRVVSVGLVNRTIVHPREVFADPLTDRAAAVVVCHNHPSGNVQPSDEDKQVTSRLVEAGVTLGIQVLDHIIFSDRGYYSFLEHGAL